jgi:ribosomal protein L16 Arg81 hydroxylase
MHLFIGDVPSIAENSTLIEKLNNCRRQLEAQGKEVELVDGDVLFIAASLRHGVAHGDMSLHSVGVEKSSVVKLVELLAQKVLELTENEFNSLIDKLVLSNRLER